MPGVFLSHSSKDKDVVFKIAAQLLHNRIPVWLDIWQMDLGASLTKNIFKAIDNRTYVIIAISTNPVESNWVADEPEAALTKER